MNINRFSLAAFCVVLVGALAWLTNAQQPKLTPLPWKEVAPGVFRTVDAPYGYALVHEGKAMLIDCPIPGDRLDAIGVKQVEGVLLTHHHRDSVAAIEWYLKRKVPVRATKSSAEWLSVEGVAKYWQDSLPLRSSRTGYFVRATGVDGVDYSLVDGQKIAWGGKTIDVIATPGHSRDHLSYAWGEAIFCGDAIAAPGKVWAPFCTDWDHWTDAGLKPTHESLRKLAALKPSAVYPAHAEPIVREPSAILEQTAKAVEEMAFLKSFERYTKRLGDVPQYRFLVPKEQIASGGDKPWAKVSDHLFITGNTYVLVSKDANTYLVFDPWGQRSIDQLAKLKQAERLGKLEVVMFSHAHYDHFDGVYLLPDRDSFVVWALDRVADPLKTPFRWRAPFLDSRPIAFDRTFRDGESAAWREYTFKFHHFPGQTEYTMAVEATIDGKRCLFTADNFFHQDQFSGSGGWMGLNRSFPLPYAHSAARALEINPEWVLAEHGGPYEFNAEDYRRRVKWGEASARAADAISPSGHHRRDWDPSRITAEPILQKAKPGAQVKATIRVDNFTLRTERVNVTLQGRGVVADQSWSFEIGANKSATQPFTLRLPADIKPGRHIFLLTSTDATGVEGCDSFVAIDVE